MPWLLLLLILIFNRVVADVKAHAHKPPLDPFRMSLNHY